MIKVRNSPPCPISVHHLASFSSDEDGLPTPALSSSLNSPPLTPVDLDAPHNHIISAHGTVDEDVPMTFLMYKLFRILEETWWQQLIYWTEDRSCIEISNIELFSRTALFEYFDTNNIDNFFQQLYLNGFNVDTIGGYGKQRRTLSNRVRIMHPEFATYKISSCMDDTLEIDDLDWTTDDNVFFAIESMNAVQNNMKKQLQLLKESMDTFRAEMADLHSIQNRSQQVLEIMQEGVRKICNNLENVPNTM